MKRKKDEGKERRRLCEAMRVRNINRPRPKRDRDTRERERERRKIQTDRR
jgi:hypothetical protein